ncbi:MAG TPA: hypothetical protein VGP63_01555 [Planctomycetaceae bacterium]|jgi:hypothetical protein|nr:hypothetical protein [Planctomycetaceae bacterium]
MVIMAFIGSALVAGLVFNVVLAGSYKAGALASFICLLVSFFFAPAVGFYPPVACTSLALLVICLVCWGRTPQVKPIAIIALAALGVGMGTGTVVSLQRMGELRHYRETYPLVSVAARLTYESQKSVEQSTPSGRTVSRFGPPPPMSPAWDVLSIAETQELSSARQGVLKRLHAATVEEFVNARGFGVVRMIPVNDFWLKSRRRPPVALPGTTEPYPSRDRSDPRTNATLSFVRPAESGSPLTSELWGVHKQGLNDFFDPDDLGWAIDRDHVAGFVPHRFSDEFGFSRLSEHPVLELRSLQLVSLRRFGQPMVYVTNKQLPKMDEIQNIPTRELNVFEAAALDSLAKGEDLCYEQRGHIVFALGALRAREQCTKCHEVERGALLGAFSYEFLGNAPSAKPPGKVSSGSGLDVF